MSKVLIFGATGSVGKHIFYSFQKLTPHVIGTSTQINEHLENLKSIDPVDVVVWCQGFNINDNILDFQEDEYLKVMNANVLYIIKTFNFLLYD